VGGTSASERDASLLAVAFLAAHGASSTVVELAAAASISVRTFHRYFPRKEDLLRPAMRDALDLLRDVVADQPAAVPLGDALMAGWAAVASGAYRERTRTLLPAVFSDAGYSAVWTDELARSSRSLHPVVAGRLGCAEEDPRVGVACAVFLALADVAARRTALDGDTTAVLREDLALLDSGLFGTTPGRARTGNPSSREEQPCTPFVSTAPTTSDSRRSRNR
jgi:AcrR family transcriptional regulator